MSLSTTIGTLAVINVTVIHLPHLKKMYQDPSCRPQRWPVVMLHLSASILWFIYGILTNMLPIMLVSIFYGIISMLLIYSKRKTHQTITNNQNVPSV